MILKQDVVTILAKFTGFEVSCASGLNSSSVCEKSIAADLEECSCFGAMESICDKTIEIKILIYDESIRYYRGKNPTETSCLLFSSLVIILHLLP